MATESPPIRHNLTEENGAITMPWILYFNQTFNGDGGTPWTPTFVSLTEVGGSATITGRYYQISRYLTYFNILIDPATNTSATAGTTYVDNFPLTSYSNGVCATVANKLGGGLGMVEASSNRIYVPAWSTVTSAINVMGIVEAT